MTVYVTILKGNFYKSQLILSTAACISHSAKQARLHRSHFLHFPQCFQEISDLRPDCACSSEITHIHTRFSFNWPRNVTSGSGPRTRQ